MPPHWKELYSAAARSDLARTKELLASGVPVKNSQVFIAIEAASNGNVGYHTPSSFQPTSIPQLVAIIRLLLRAGANCNAIDRWGNSILGAAVQSGEKRIVREVIRAGAKLNGVSGGRTPLIFAVIKNRVDLIKLLLRAGANIDARDIYGCTALMEAAYRSEAKLVSLLLKLGANPRLKWMGRSALDIARREQRAGNVLVIETALRIFSGTGVQPRNTPKARK